MNTASLVTSVQGHSHFTTPDSHTVVDTVLNAFGLLGHLSTLLAHVQMAVNQHPQVFFCQTTFQPLYPKSIALHRGDMMEAQDSALVTINSVLASGLAVPSELHLI